MQDISVVIPVGPFPHNQRYLAEAIESCWENNADEILLIDDMAGLVLGPSAFPSLENNVWMVDDTRWPVIGGCRVWESPWRLGVPAAFNMGVSLASNNLVFMLGSDDKLLPGCLEEVAKAYERNQRQDAFYWVGIEYSDDRAEKYQFQPCNTAAVTKGLWKLTGGFPPELASGACDAGFVSILLGNKMSDRLICVNPSKPLAWYRVSNDSDTAGRMSWQGAILDTRNVLTSQWKQPQWGRFGV